MNKLLDDSVKVANRMNLRGYMILSTNLIFFLRHMLVETCIYCSRTRSKLLQSRPGEYFSIALIQNIEKILLSIL